MSKSDTPSPPLGGTHHFSHANGYPPHSEIKMTTAYKQLNDATKGHDIEIYINVSTLTTILDQSILPKNVKQAIIDDAIRQISHVRTNQPPH